MATPITNQRKVVEGNWEGNHNCLRAISLNSSHTPVGMAPNVDTLLVHVRRNGAKHHVLAIPYQ